MKKQSEHRGNTLGKICSREFTRAYCIKFSSVWYADEWKWYYNNNVFCQLGTSRIYSDSIIILRNIYTQPQTCYLIMSRRKHVKINDSWSEWRSLSKGVPQSYVMCPLRFNVFLSYIFYLLENMCMFYNFIDTDVNFTSHSYEICMKSTRQLHAISRISKYLNEKCKMGLYNAFIISNFNYCNTLWHFSNEDDTMKLEKIPKCELRLIFNDFESDYDDLLKRADRPLLYIRRLRAVGLETYHSLRMQNPHFYINCLFPNKNIISCKMGAK